MKAQQGSDQVTPERIMSFMFGYAAPLIIEAAVRQRVFDVLDGGAKTVDQVSSASGASARGLRIVMNALVGLGFLAREGDKYALTPESAAFLVSSKPAFVGGMYRHTSTLLSKWLQLNDVVKTGKPALSVNQEAEGAKFFQDFVEDLFPFNYGSAQALAGALKVADAKQPVRVLDLATGSGVWGIALAQKSPQVQVTAVDWPSVLEVTRRVAQRHGLADRFKYVAGDLLTVDFGRDYQVATLGHILHSEGEERSRALLKKTFAALAPGGVIAIAEFLVDADRRGPVPPLIFAVNMLVNTDCGDTFSLAEIGGWLEEAGFKNVRTVDSPGPSPLVLADKPK